MSAIFISHSSKDNEFCKKLITWLDDLGHRSVFLDFDASSGISAGSSWEQKLYQELRVCRAVIVVCSEDLMNSKWCFAEITQARSLGKHIFPIKVGACDIDSLLSDSQVVDFLQLEETAAFERLKNGLATAGIDAEDPYDWDGSRSPYPGLLSFQEADASIFFGREKEIGEGLDVLNGMYRYGGSGLVMTLGASGSGKSSLIRAGIVPRLKRDPERWLVIDPFQPRNDPFKKLAKVLSRAYRSYNADITITEADLNTDFIEDLLEVSKQENASVVVIIDQFEELLNRPPEHVGTQFLHFLREILDTKENKLIVLATMRSDFLGTFQQDPVLGDLTYSQILVGPIHHTALVDIIKKPSKLAGVKIEQKLLQALIEDTGTNDALPLLAFTLRELYDKFSDGNHIKYKDYKELLGGIQGAVAKSAESILQNIQLTEKQEEYLRKAFLFMSRINENGQYTREVALWSDMPPEVHDILERFVNGRLLVSNSNENSKGTIEVAHETLFRSWERLKNWLDKDKEFLLWRRRLARAKEEWDHNAQDKKALLDGVILHEASNWLKLYKDQLDAEEQVFVQASLHEAVKKRRRRRVQIIGAMSLFAIIGAFMTVLFFNAKKESNRASANHLMAEANREVENDPTLSLQLASVAILKHPQGADLLKEESVIYGENAFSKVILKHEYDVKVVTFSPDGKLVLTGAMDNTARLWDLKGNPIGKIMEHTDNVLAVAFSPDGKTIMTGSRDKTAHLWDLKGNPIGKDMQHTDNVLDIAFSPDGKTVLTGSRDHTAQLWDLGGNPIGKPIQHSAGIGAVAFSLDGKMILTGSRDHTARLWDFKGNPIGETMQHSDLVVTAVFSPDGKTILTSSRDHTARLWDLEGNPIGKSMEHTDRVHTATFSPDGSMILTGSWDDSARLWDLEGNTIGNIMEHSGPVVVAMFSPDGKTILTGSRDYTARLWDLRGNPVGKILRHSLEVDDVAFSPDGKTVLTGSKDSTARLWNLEDNPIGKTMEHAEDVLDIAFSQDGETVLTGSLDHTARLWDLAGKPIGEIMQHSGAVVNVSFSPDGTTILTGSHDNTARLWDLRGNPIGKPMEHVDDILDTAFSPDGKTIMTSANDNTTRLWDLEGNPIGKPIAYAGEVMIVAFSPDGKTFLTGLRNQKAKLWDLKGNALGIPMVYSGEILAVAFSPDGKTVLTSSSNNTARLWDLEGEPLGKPMEHSGEVLDVVFSPDGKTILTGSRDNMARLWDLKGNPIGKPIEHSGDVDLVAFSPDGKRVLTSSNDNTARLWDFRGVLIGKTMEHSDIIRAIAFSPDGKTIMTSSNDNTASLWEIITLEEFIKGDGLAPLTAEQKEKYEIE